MTSHSVPLVSKTMSTRYVASPLFNYDVLLMKSRDSDTHYTYVVVLTKIHITVPMAMIQHIIQTVYYVS